MKYKADISIEPAGFHYFKCAEQELKEQIYLPQVPTPKCFWLQEYDYMKKMRWKRKRQRDDRKIEKKIIHDVTW